MKIKETMLGDWSIEQLGQILRFYVHEMGHMSAKEQEGWIELANFPTIDEVKEMYACLQLEADLWCPRCELEILPQYLQSNKEGK